MVVGVDVVMCEGRGGGLVLRYMEVDGVGYGEMDVNSEMS